VEIHDMNYGLQHGTFFNKKKPLTIEARFTVEEKIPKKQKP